MESQDESYDLFDSFPRRESRTYKPENPKKRHSAPILSSPQNRTFLRTLLIRMEIYISKVGGFTHSNLLLLKKRLNLGRDRKSGSRFLIGAE